MSGSRCLIGAGVCSRRSHCAFESLPLLVCSLCILLSFRLSFFAAFVITVISVVRFDAAADTSGEMRPHPFLAVLKSVLCQL